MARKSNEVNMTAFPTAALKKDIDGHEVRIRHLEKHDISQDEKISQLAAGLLNVNNDAKDLEKRHQALEHVVIESGATMKLVRWILAALGVSVVGLIWSLITGQASVIFH